MKTLKSFLEVYKPKSPDEQKFVDKHVTIKHKDRNEVNGKANEDDVFNASNVKPVDRKANRQGYDVGEDEKVYEEVELDEAALKQAEDRHFEKQSPKMQTAINLHLRKGKDYRDAVAAARRHVKEDVEDVDLETMDEQELLDFALGILEKTLTPAELTKREEIAKAMERENPGMSMSKKMAIATAQAKKVAEEVEEIDEISSQLASRYLQKKRERDYDTSADGTYSKMKKPQPLNKIHRDIKSTVRALRTIEKSNKTNEEVEINEGLMHDRYMRSHGKKARGTGSWAFTTKQYGSPKEKDMHFTSGQKSLSDAHKEAAAKLGTKNLYVMEEVEAIDELSKDTMKSYKDNAAWDKDYETGAVDPKARERREKGIAMATKKLAKEAANDVPFEGPYSKAGPRKDEYGNTIINVPRHLAKQAMKSLKKEDIIDRAIDRYIPEQYKFTPVERLLNRLNGLSEAHVDVVLNLFNSLNEENQMVVLEQANTVEGVNRLLDFAIQNRGE